MNILLVYFSGAGNTRLYSEMIARGINERGHRCDLLDIEKIVDAKLLWRNFPVVPAYILEAEKRVPLGLSINEIIRAYENDPAKDQQMLDLNKKIVNFNNYIANFDLIGFGSPIYFFEPAAVFSSFIKSIPGQNRKKAFTYGTHMEGPVDFGLKIKSELELRGFDVIGHVDDYIAHTELMPLFGKSIATGEILKKYLNYRLPSINKKINKFLDSLNIKSGSDFKSLSKSETMPAGNVMKYIGKVVEAGLYATMNHSFGNRFIADKCSKCGLCSKKCPMGLIEVGNDGYPLRKSHCMYCLRCLCICPQEAVSYTPLYDGKARFKGF